MTRTSVKNDAPSLVPERAVPVAGTVTLRVRYCECDPMGVVHHAAYIPWLEIGRTELLREAGVSYAELEAAGVFLAIVKMECSYRRPAYYDDLIEVRTRVVGGSRIKIRHEYEVYRASGDANGPSPRAEAAGGGTQGGGNNLPQVRTPGELLMTGSTMLASLDRSGRPAGLPEWLVPAGG